MTDDSTSYTFLPVLGLLAELAKQLSPFGYEITICDEVGGEMLDVGVGEGVSIWTDSMHFRHMPLRERRNVHRHNKLFATVDERMEKALLRLMYASHEYPFKSIDKVIELYRAEADSNNYPWLYVSIPDSQAEVQDAFIRALDACKSEWDSI